MKFPLLFILFPFIAFGQIQIGQTIHGEATGDLFGTNLSISSDGSTVAIGAFDNDGNGTNSGHVRIYRNINGVWTQIGQDINGEGAGDLSGSSVSLSCNGRIVAIGASNNNNNSGHVRIYENNNGVWLQVGEDIDGSSSQRFFGSSVSLSCNGNIIAIGSNLNSTTNSNSGQVNIFRNEGNTWSRIGSAINDAITANVLGTTVSLSDNGNTVAIGTPFDIGDGVLSGHVRVYKNLQESWNQIGDDITSDMLGDQFGRELSLSGDGTVVAISSMIDSVDNNQTGQVIVYKNVGENWVQTGNKITGEMAGDQFGRGVSLSRNGSILAVGARLNNDNGISSGSVRIYQNQNNLWRQIGEDIDGEMAGDQSGIGVSLSAEGTIVAIGSNLSNSSTGHVRVFDITNTLLSTKEASITSQFKLFPNPAPSNVTIELPKEEAVAIQHITMYNALGQHVFSTQDTTINTSQFPKGIYIVEIRTNEGIASKKLIVD
ncbi:T9SS type A sorting domain-containing protein [uncultured Dokdonia sp.]|uniref:T9SS type A sorting domain-containing protein n=1 Tax=uncultured Dokdonia sp. TaxID=575653 RepID=UPI002606D4A7|nr:T9SS type A sorting domain-containing protein [uncultured Dokdonia sp.]